MGFIDLLSWAGFGLVVGAIARFLWPRRQSLGCLTTMLLGVTGSVVGGMITYALTSSPERDYHPASWLMSILGAIVVLWIYGATRSRPGAQ